jgi:sulfur carrier protein
VARSSPARGFRSGCSSPGSVDARAVKVLLRNPRREVEVAGPITVRALLVSLDLNPESVLVIVGDELVTSDARLNDDAAVEIRPVISGGCVEERATDGGGAQ